MIYTVVTRYELGEMKRIIRQVDNKAFMNITETVEIVSRFQTHIKKRKELIFLALFIFYTYYKIR